METPGTQGKTSRYADLVRALFPVDNARHNLSQEEEAEMSSFCVVHINHTSRAESGF